MEINIEKYKELIKQGHSKEAIRAMLGMTDYSFRKLVKSYEAGAEIKKPIGFIRHNDKHDKDCVKKVCDIDSLEDKVYFVYDRAVKKDVYKGVAVVEVVNDVAVVIKIVECQERSKNYSVYMELVQAVECYAKENNLNGVCVNLGQDKIDIVLKKINYKTVIVGDNNFAIKVIGGQSSYIDNLCEQQESEELIMKNKWLNSTEYSDKIEFAINKRREGYKAWQADYWHEKASREAEEQEKIRLKNEQKEKARFEALEHQKQIDEKIKKTMLGVEHYIEETPFEPLIKNPSLYNTPESRAEIYKLCKVNKDNPQALDYLWRHATEENFHELVQIKLMNYGEIQDLFQVSYEKFKAKIKALGITKKNNSSSFWNLKYPYDYQLKAKVFHVNEVQFSILALKRVTAVVALNCSELMSLKKDSKIAVRNKYGETYMCRIVKLVEAPTFIDLYEKDELSYYLENPILGAEYFLQSLSQQYTPKQEKAYGTIAMIVSLI